MNNPASILGYVAELQELRVRFEREFDSSLLPVDHCRVNFGEGIEVVVSSVLEIYAAQVLNDVEKRQK